MKGVRSAGSLCAMSMLLHSTQVITGFQVIAAKVEENKSKWSWDRREALLKN